MLCLTRAQSREVDRLATEVFGIPGIVLMENAAEGIVEAIGSRFPQPRPIAVVCGPGNNGGDGFAAARLLKNAGVDVRIHLACPRDRIASGSDAGVNFGLVRALGVPIVDDTDLSGVGLILDAVFGTGLATPVRPPYNAVLAAINACGVPVLAVDLPSGLDADTGRPLGIAVKADITATMVAPKVGFSNAAHLVGEVVVVDIGAPEACVERVLRDA